MKYVLIAGLSIIFMGCAHTTSINQKENQTNTIKRSTSSYYNNGPTAPCYSKLSQNVEGIVSNYISKTLGVDVKSNVMGIAGGGSWTNGPNAADRFKENIGYNTLMVSLLSYIDGGRGSSNGYRMDPLVQVRMVPKTCEVLKTVVMQINSDSKEGRNQLVKDGYSLPIGASTSTFIHGSSSISNYIEGMFPFHRKYHVRK